ncbi:MAG: D-glycerate dehydrogenase [Gemmatimonadales bacterium]|nr:MAG: D-glycerate dehydrogenase [Gemmatimonadales bacterium]
MGPSAVTGRIVVTRRIPEAGMALLWAEPGVEVEVLEEAQDRGPHRDRLLEAVAAADVLLCLLTEVVDRELLSAGRGLRGVSQMAVGVDNVDVPAATELGIPVGHTPGLLTDTTADLAWALLMATARHIPQAHQYQVEGRYRIWGPELFTGADLSPGGSGRRKVLGIVGFGRIGQAVARRSVGFDMEVVAHDPRNRERVEEAPGVRWAGLDELLESSDFVSLHTPLTPETHHLIGERELRRMKPSAILVNTARGPVVDETALVRALEEGWIAGAGLDVYEEEPHMAAGLAHLPNVVLLPHIGSASGDTRGRMARMAAMNALAFLRGEAGPHTVNPQVYATLAYGRRQSDRRHG